MMLAQFSSFNVEIPLAGTLRALIIMTVLVAVVATGARWGALFGQPKSG